MTTTNLASVDYAERRPLLEPPSGLASQTRQHEAVHPSENASSSTGTVSLVIKFTLALTGEGS